MKAFISRLSGWQRLWVVFAIACLVLTTIIVIVAQKKTVAVEDESVISNLNADQVKRFRIISARRPVQPLRTGSSNYTPPPTALFQEVGPTGQLIEVPQPENHNYPASRPPFDPDLYLLKKTDERVDNLFKTAQFHGMPVPDQNKFRSQLSDSNFRRQFYVIARQRGVSMPPYDTYESVVKDAPLVDTIAFPNSLSDAEIRNIISTTVARFRSTDSVRSVATQLVTQRNKLQAIRGKNENDELRRSNITFIGYGYLACFVFLLAIYLLGYAIGWIYRGFKQA